MTKFTNRIKPDSTELERFFLSVYTGNLWDALEKIKDWHSPEHIEKEVQMKVLKLQHQALPVVPDYIGKLINTFGPPKDGEYINYAASYPENKKELDWIDNHQKAWLTALLVGFTIEKPQQKRYEVKLLSGESMHFNPIGNPKNIKDYRFSFGNYAGWKTQFTKSELAEIKDGMFLKRLPGGTPLDDLGKDKSYYVWIEDCNYWKNPFIELMPVGDGE